MLLLPPIKRYCEGGAAVVAHCRLRDINYTRFDVQLLRRVAAAIFHAQYMCMPLLYTQ